MNNLPYIPVYVGDWLKDVVSGCSLPAQGLWLRMMFIMHTAEEYGCLVLDGQPMPEDMIARRCGAALDEYRNLLAELLRTRVPGMREDGVIFSRRMVRDAEKRLKCAEAGKKGGGNPTFKGDPKGRRKGRAKGTPKDISLSTSFSVAVSTEEKKETKEPGETAAGAVQVVPPPKEKPFHVQFVDRWSAAYQAMVHEPFKADKHHFIIAQRLIAKYGLDPAVAKAKTLALLCRDRSTWFTKGGWGDFTIEKLSSQWNSIIPDAAHRTREDANQAELKKTEAMNARVNSALG